MKKNKKAFSIIELSIFITVIGVLVLNEASSLKLIRNMRVLSAQNVTKSSPINSMKGLLAWYETSLDSSVKKSENTNGSYVTIWADNNPFFSSKKNIVQLEKQISRPIYVEDGINGIPALKFDGIDDYMIIPNLKINNNTLSIFLVGKRVQYSHYQGVLSGFNKDNSDDIADGSLIAFYDQNSYSTIASGQNYSNVKSIGDNKPYILTTIFNGIKNVNYINGNIGTNSKGSPYFDINRFFVGARYNMSQADSFFNGYLAEIIIFDRALNNEERKSIEHYLSRKYSIKILQ